MSDPENLPVLAGGSGEKKSRRGRPKGAKNKAPAKTARAVADLFKYSEAQHGTTPGQQMLDLAVVTKREMRLGRAQAIAAGLDPKDFSPVELGLRVKVRKYEQLYGMTAKDALAYVYRMRSDLAPMTNQKQGAAEAPESEERGMLDMVPVDEAMFAKMQGNQQFDLDLEAEVTAMRSQDDQEAE